MNVKLKRIVAIVITALVCFWLIDYFRCWYPVDRERDVITSEG